MAKKKAQATEREQNSKIKDLDPLFPPFPEETSRAYRAFMDFLAMGTNRTMNRLWVQYTDHVKELYVTAFPTTTEAELGAFTYEQITKKLLAYNSDLETQMPPSVKEKTIQSWGARFKWQERVQDYDLWLARQYAVEQANRQELVKRNSLSLIDELYLQVKTLLSELPKFRKKREVTQKDPTTGEKIKVITMAVNLEGYRAMTEIIHKLILDMRLTAHLPSTIAYNQVNDARPPATQINISGLENFLAAIAGEEDDTPPERPELTSGDEAFEDEDDYDEDEDEEEELEQESSDDEPNDDDMF